jgi:feruloyl-CoA synthase
MTLSAPLLGLDRPAPSAVLERRRDGTEIITSGIPYEAPPRLIIDLLADAAASVPERTFLAARGPDRAWQHLTYKAAEAQSTAVAAWMIDHGVAPGDRVLILSENSLAHALISFGALRAGAVVVPVSPTYALADDPTLLLHVARLIEPRLIFADDSRRYGRALATLSGMAEHVVTCDGGAGAAFDRLLETSVGPAVAARRRQITSESPAKILFTSGSTGLPKGAIVTHGSMAAGARMLGQVGEPPNPERPSILLCWLPWHHVFGGNVHVHNTLRLAGTLYIDDGRPLGGRFAATIDNLREISPSAFSSVPAAYAMLADALEQDAALRRKFFANLRALSYGGALLPQDLCDRLQRLAVAETGYRISFGTGWGMTETSGTGISCYWHLERTGMIGLPLPGVTLKLVPIEGEGVEAPGTAQGRFEVRIKGPNVMPGYYRRPDLDAQAFDEEGFFRTGDAAVWGDPERPEVGLRFAGRLAEQFKLQSGSWVQGGHVRQAVLEALRPIARDVVVAGPDRPYLGALVWLDTPMDGAANSVAAELRRRLRDYNQAAGGSSRQVRRLLIVDDPLSLAAGELTDKRSVNQRRVIERRAATIERLYAEPRAPGVVAVEA